MPRAVVMHGADLPLQVCDITLDPPKEAEVCVRIAAAGVCHSDLMAYEWNGAGMTLPVVLGHEASGVVEAVGPGVTHLQKGDHVVLTPNPQCHHCGYCDRGQWTLCETSVLTATGHALDGTTRMHLNDVPLSPLAGLGAFSELTVVPATSVVKIDRDMPLAEAALIGCAVITGFGAAVNVAHVELGDTVAVIGCGGTGLSAIQGARLKGAAQIIAIDIAPSKFELARQFGATATIAASSTTNVIETVRKLTGGQGVDIAIDSVGSEETVNQMVAITRRGGQCVTSGLYAPTFTVSAGLFTAGGRSMKGSLLGMSNFSHDFPMLVRLFNEGTLKLTEMISRRIRLDQVGEAFEAMKKGEVARSVIEMQ